MGSFIHHHNHVTDKKQHSSTCSAETDESSLNITKQSNTELLLSSYKNISHIHQTYWSTSLHILIPGPQTSVRLRLYEGLFFDLSLKPEDTGADRSLIIYFKKWDLQDYNRRQVKQEYLQIQTFISFRSEEKMFWVLCKWDSLLM